MPGSLFRLFFLWFYLWHGLGIPFILLLLLVSLCKPRFQLGMHLKFKRLGPKVNEESSGEISDQMTLARSSMIESILRAFEKHQ
jgi:hypothetical protein